MEKLELEKLDFTKSEGGLIPAIVQDYRNGTVLMLGYMNREALGATLSEKQVTFFSRSKNRLWKKGETSGNVLLLKSIRQDCDSDALLIEADPQGPTCHLGTESCFDQTAGVLGKLEKTIQDRKLRPREGSYTTSLFQEGISRIAQKVGEEAVELAIAAQHTDNERCIEEASDLLYHLLVLLTEKGLSLDLVQERLASRIK